MSCSQLAGILHVASQVPELFKANPGDINNVVGLIDWRLWIRSPWRSAAQWHDKSGEVLIQSEKP